MSFVTEFTEHGTNRRLVIEDDDRTVYAYLFVGDEIVSDVWICNRPGVPQDPSWDDPEEMPFPNKAQFVSTSQTLQLTPESHIEPRWDDRGVDVYVESTRTARLEPSAFPGWSRTAAVDSPVALQLKPE